MSLFKPKDKVRIKESVSVEDLHKIGFGDTAAAKKKLKFTEVYSVNKGLKYQNIVGTQISTNAGWFWDWMLELADGSERRRGHPLCKIFALDKEERKRFGLDKPDISSKLKVKCKIP